MRKIVKAAIAAIAIVCLVVSVASLYLEQLQLQADQTTLLQNQVGLQNQNLILENQTQTLENQTLTLEKRLQQMNDEIGNLSAYETAGHVNVNLTLHVWSTLIRNGTIISQTYHTMTKTSQGIEWLQSKIVGTDPNNATINAWIKENANATYIGLSADTSSVSASWCILPSEITSNGLGRANGAITYTGSGTWNCTYSFSVTGTQSVQEYGYYIDSYAGTLTGTSATLIGAEQQGSGAVKNCIAGDTLIVTVQGTLT
jgi:hypothetical protein